MMATPTATGGGGRAAMEVEDGGWAPPKPTETSRYALRHATLAETPEATQLKWLPASQKESWWPTQTTLADCTVRQLKTKLAGQRKLHGNRRMMAALPDGGEKIARKIAELEGAIASAEAA
eukprot:CAMPEP_0206294512 /NCGR_PEP_ID=MMETSP0106_2-20121207/4696_1 /ASSEMBLY_ACC=CAM_ASM_000206 /TAXON_ID=81532 /ORGANISM="Acanthoeca-like sp., Strain 10tr" /LENGTH=120 /DNA_ID=CAMNT_0053725151 /DNA_START=15 /DNA_END=373 /DNA_ORIENTATION=+